MRQLARFCRRIDDRQFFSEPVDPLEVPDYYDIVTQPMDLRTIAAKVANNSYPTLKEFVVRLLCKGFLTAAGRRGQNILECHSLQQARISVPFISNKIYRKRKTHF